MKFKDRGKANLANAVECVRAEESALGLTVYTDQTQELSLSEWFSQNKTEMEQSLMSDGALLFRGFDINDVNDFQQFTLDAIGLPSNYIEGATPRTHLKDGVYTSTEFPQDHKIDQHNELSYTVSPPDRICFHCVRPPESMGQTPIADVSGVLSYIDPSIVEEFESRHGWTLLRSYGFGFGPNVIDAFGVKNELEIRHYCETNNIELLYLNGSQARTKQTRKAVHEHPVSKIKLWFNHIAFWHYSCLREDIFKILDATFPLNEFPYATYFGDGGEIPESYIENISDAYLKARIVFDWQQRDVLLLDNWRFSHGRLPFSGDRKILAAMG